jgi:hypothetical protein
VEYIDPLLGTLYCTADEAYTPQEISDIYGSLTPIDPADVPGPIRKKLREIVP